MSQGAERKHPGWEAWLSLENERLVRFADHEMMLLFRNDEAREAFESWWHGPGGKAFAAYYAEWRMGSHGQP